MRNWLLLIILFSSSSFAGSIHLAVASNFAPTAQVLADRFKDLAHDEVIISSASSGKLYLQIKQGAPFDIFLSADTDKPKKLYKEGYGLEAPQNYATGRLVLWSREIDLLTRTENPLNITDIKRLAIANPATAPYGAAAKEVIDHLTFPPVSWQLIQGDNIAQTYQFAKTGNVDAAFIAQSQAIHEMSGYFWPVPRTLHSPLQQAALLLNNAQNKPEAQAFYRFIFSTEAKEILKQQGYE
jgi:molybdate transport system substrate-binding protein